MLYMYCTALQDFRATLAMDLLNIHHRSPGWHAFKRALVVPWGAVISHYTPEGKSLGGNMEQQLAKYSNAVPVMFANGKYLLANHLQDLQGNQLLTNIIVAILLNFIQL